MSRVTDRYKLTQALVVDPLYLQHSYSESAIDYRVGQYGLAKALYLSENRILAKKSFISRVIRINIRVFHA